MASLPLISVGISNSLSSNKSSKKWSTNQPWKKSHLVGNLDVNRHNKRMPNSLSALEIKNREYWRARGIDDGSCGIPPYMPPPPPSALDVVREFYKAINERDLERFDKLLSDNCQYEDLIFYLPFQGKEGVKSFLNKMMDAMGSNVHITIDHMSEGEDFTATTLCHLQWNKNPIPFTSASRHFKCQQIDGKLLISKIVGMEELPIKPGDIVLKLLKAATTFFDLRPMIAEGLLRVYHDNSS